MAQVKVQPDDSLELFIYGEQANIEFFLGSQTPLTAEASSNKTVSVSSHPRKRFIGDNNGSTVSSHSRVILVDPGAKNGNSLPGKPFYVDELNDDLTPKEDGELRQFTYVGAFRDLHAIFVGDAQVACWLIAPSGKKYQINKSV